MTTNEPTTTLTRRIGLASGPVAAPIPFSMRRPIWNQISDRIMPTPAAKNTTLYAGMPWSPKMFCARTPVRIGARKPPPLIPM